jgi:hypothetical protein
MSLLSQHPGFYISANVVAAVVAVLGLNGIFRPAAALADFHLDIP